MHKPNLIKYMSLVFLTSTTLSSAMVRKALSNFPKPPSSKSDSSLIRGNYNSTQAAPQGSINMRKACVKNISEIFDGLMSLHGKEDIPLNDLLSLKHSPGINLITNDGILAIALTMKDCEPYFEGGVGEIMEISYKRAIEKRPLRNEIEKKNI